MKHFAKLEPGNSYHIYGRANGYENCFLKEKHYHFFLQQYIEYIWPIAETYSYCLMPNHYHFLVAIRDTKTLKRIAPGFRDRKCSESKFLSKQFSNFFSSYTLAFNKDIGRKGGLFIKPFRRVQLEEEGYFYNLIRYIHFNPVEAGLCNSPDGWRFSSFNTICNRRASFINADEVLRFFGTMEDFLNFHKYSPVKTEEKFGDFSFPSLVSLEDVDKVGTLAKLTLAKLNVNRAA